MGGSVSDFSEQGTAPQNILYTVTDFELGNEIYFTVTVDITDKYEKDGEEYYKQTFYINGQKLYEGGYNKKQWDSLINNINSLKYFCIGRSSMSYDGEWHYSKANTYTIRLYNRALTKDEVENNYNTSKAYHES